MSTKPSLYEIPNSLEELKSRAMPSPSFSIRPGKQSDSYTAFKIFERSLADLNRRTGLSNEGQPSDPQLQAQMWQRFRPLYHHLAQSAENFWIAERDGKAIGYARSIRRDGVRELTDFFILPDQQSAGIGRELLRHAFPAGSTRHRSIIATTDLRAQALYLKAGVYPRFPIYYFGRAPEAVEVRTDLVIQPVASSTKILDVMGDLDGRLLGYRRDEDHEWLLGNRQGYLYLRAGRPVGYGYTGEFNGPFALLDERDFPAVLAHAEARAADSGLEEVGFDIPMINQAAVSYLLQRGFRMGAFVVYFMSDVAFGKFENYIITSPMFIL